MPLSIFQHRPPAHYREVVGRSSRFGNTFGGDPASFGIRFRNCEPLHLIYRLNQADPAVREIVPGLKWLPLFYHFSFASLDGELLYRIAGDGELELIAPLSAEFDPDFPYPGFPRQFARSPVAFRKQKYDPRRAEDAVKLAAVFGAAQLSRSEMKRAIAIAEKRAGTISEWGSGGGTPGKDFPDFSPADLVRCVHREPFLQGPPRKSCDNPSCTAKIAYRTKTKTFRSGKALRELIGKSTLTIPSRIVRRDSMRVFAIFQPDDDDRVWPQVQLIFEVCECCRCIRVSNQCD